MQELQKGVFLQDGRYKIERVLGQGGFGITYLATKEPFGDKVAIKEFFINNTNSRLDDNHTVSVSIEVNRKLFDEQRRKFKKEAQRIHGLSSPVIVSVTDLFDENGTTYYVMEYIDGQSLDVYLKKSKKPLPEAIVINYLRQMLEGLSVIHKAGIWHLDIKPANIMADNNGNLKLIDFGASKQQSSEMGITTSTSIGYTTGYAPAEQISGDYRKFGPWTDFYALGATLYKLLTNNNLPTINDLEEDTSTDKYIALPMPNVSQQTKKMILWFMQKNRLNRPKNTDEILEFLKDSNSHTKTSIDETTMLTGIQENPSDSESVSPSYEEKVSFFRNTKYLFVIGVVILVWYISMHFSIKSGNSGVTTKNSTPLMVQNYACKIRQGMCIYTGQISSDSIPNGNGQATFEDGRYYKGIFVNGKLEADNAYFRYQNGDEYVGSFTNDHFNKGTYTIKETGERFVGIFDEKGQPKQGDWYDSKWNKIESL